MESRFDNSFLFGRWHALPRGPHVRLRLVYSGDARRIQALLDGQGCVVGELEFSRYVRFDPRRRVSVCATALVEGAERLVGFGTIACFAEEPDLIVVDQDITEGLDELLGRALRRRAQFGARRAA